MMDAIAKWVDLDVVRHALGYGIAAVITAVCAWLVAWLKSRTSGALVDKWWEYVRPRVDSAMAKAAAARKDGIWSQALAKQILREELAELVQTFAHYGEAKPSERELAAAREELQEAMARIT